MSILCILAILITLHGVVEVNAFRVVSPASINGTYGMRNTFTTIYNNRVVPVWCGVVVGVRG